MAGRRGRMCHFRVLKVAPETLKSKRRDGLQCLEQPFWPQTRILGGQSVILEVCVVTAPSPIPASISAPTPTPAPTAVPSLSFNVDVVRNLSQNLNRQPQPQILNISTSSLDMTT